MSVKKSPFAGCSDSFMNRCHSIYEIAFGLSILPKASTSQMMNFGPSSTSNLKSTIQIITHTIKNVTMKIIKIYQKEHENYDVRIVLDPFNVAIPFCFRKIRYAAQFQFFCLEITIDWQPLPF